MSCIFQFLNEEGKAVKKNRSLCYKTIIFFSFLFLFFFPFPRSSKRDFKNNSEMTIRKFQISTLKFGKLFIYFPVQNELLSVFYR